jgi:hypothetical protein
MVVEYKGFHHPTCKYKSSLKKLASDKHSIFFNFSVRGFYNTDTRLKGGSVLLISFFEKTWSKMLKEFLKKEKKFPQKSLNII